MKRIIKRKGRASLVERAVIEGYTHVGETNRGTQLFVREEPDGTLRIKGVTKWDTARLNLNKKQIERLAKDAVRIVTDQKRKTKTKILQDFFLSYTRNGNDHIVFTCDDNAMKKAAEAIELENPGWDSSRRKVVSIMRSCPKRFSPVVVEGRKGFLVMSDANTYIESDEKN